MAESSPARSSRAHTANASPFPVSGRKLSLNGWCPESGGTSLSCANFSDGSQGWRHHRRNLSYHTRPSRSRRFIRHGVRIVGPVIQPVAMMLPAEGFRVVVADMRNRAGSRFITFHLRPGYGAKRSPSSPSGLVMPSFIKRFQGSWADGTRLARRVRVRYAGVSAERADAPIMPSVALAGNMSAER